MERGVVLDKAALLEAASVVPSSVVSSSPFGNVATMTNSLKTESKSVLSVALVDILNVTLLCVFCKSIVFKASLTSGT